jgi:hypothetical protein
LADEVTIKDSTDVDRAVAADEIGGVFFQRMKLGVGPNGEAIDVSKTDPIPTVPGLMKVSDFSEAVIDASGDDDNELVAGTPSETIRVYGFFLVNTDVVPVGVKFRTGTDDFHPAIVLNPGGSWSMPRDGAPWFTTASGEALNLNLSAASQISGRLYFTKSV